MPTTTKFLIGRDITCSVTPFILGANGQLLPQAALSFVRKMARASWAFSHALEAINPLDTPVENNVQIMQNGRMELAEILENNLAASNRIANALAAGCTHFGVTYTLGGAGTRTYFGVAESYEEGYERGQNVGVLRLAPAIYNA